MSTIAATARNHMKEAWGLKTNPLPTEAIDGSDDDPYAAEAFEQENAEFIDKVVVGGLSPRRKMAFLYSHSRQAGEDTGFGKTKTMKAIRREINEDLGVTLLEAFGVEEDDRVPIGAAYTSFNTNQRTGYYPVLVDATLDMATYGEVPLLQQAWDRIVSEVGNDPDDIWDALFQAQMKLAPGVMMRPSVCAAFCDEGASGVASDIGSTSDATKLRSGLQWFNFALIAIYAAGIKRLFLFVDQLEDLATNRSQTRGRRFREMGRIRDLMEDEPSRSVLHTTFTMHDTAAADLHDFWTPHRLPAYELQRANMSRIVVLDGLRGDQEAAKVLAAWLQEGRVDGYSGDVIAPFEMSAVRALRELAEGRVGKLLPDACKVLDAAKGERKTLINDVYVREILDVDGLGPSSDGIDDAEEVGDDDLLA
jgi:hypothetical protein